MIDMYFSEKIDCGLIYKNAHQEKKEKTKQFSI